MIQKALAGLKTEMDRLNPNSSTKINAGWQERKSNQTRVALLDAAVKCLSTYGYSKTTTQLVAAEAKISRGAMLHHYATKAELISNVIDHIIFRRMESFYGAIVNLSDHERIEETEGLEVYWQVIQTPEYQAFLELSVGARTDADLRAVFDPKAKAFDAFWFNQLTLFFPEWRGQPLDKLLIAQDLIVSALEGLYLNRRVMDSPKRRRALRNFIKHAIVMLRDEEIDLS